MVITSGPGQKCFKSRFEIRQDQKASDTVWQWWINPFARLVTRLNTMLPQPFYTRTRSRKLDVLAWLCWRASSERGWWTQHGPGGAPGAAGPLGTLWGCIASGLFPLLWCLNKGVFLCCQNRKSRFGIVLLVIPLSSGQSRAGTFPFHFSRTVPSNTMQGTCLLQRAYAGTLFWHVYELHETAWFPMISKPEENLIHSRHVKNHCWLSCQPLLSTCSPQVRWGWGASQPAGVWRRLLRLLPAARHGLLASSASRAGWTAVSPWDTWGSIFLQEPTVGRGWQGCEAEARPGELPAARRGALSKWQKHAQSDYSPAYRRRGPSASGQFGL